MQLQIPDREECGPDRASILARGDAAAVGHVDDTPGAMADRGQRGAAGASSAIDALRRSASYLLLRELERGKFELLLDMVVGIVASDTDPNGMLCLALDFLGRLGRWPGYVDLLLTHPGPLRRLLALMAASPALGRYLVHNMAMLDDLVDGRTFCDLPDAARLRATIAERLLRCDADEDRTLAVLRHVKHAQVLHIVSLDLEGLLSLDEVSRALSDLADVLLETVLHLVARRLKVEAPSPIGIVAYGKLGSREMSYASDTDIVFVYDGAAGAAEEALHRLARTVNRWLTLPTAEGLLYETDFRMRPYGESGLLVTPLAAYRQYLMHEAWTWEHQALTRARWIAGDAGLGENFEHIRREVLLRPRAVESLRRDLCEMRERIAAAHSPGRDGFEVKHSRGGIIDLEFIVQYLVLHYAATHPVLAGHDDNVRTLERSAGLGLLPWPLARAACDAYRQFRRWLHASRLRGIETARVSEGEAAPHRDAVLAAWRHVICS